MIIEVLNVKEVMRKFEEAAGVDVFPAIQMGARMVQRAAKAIVPVRTGNLRNSLHVKHFKQLNTSIVYTVVEYAPYVEFGTIKMRARPYLRPAYHITKPAIIKYIEQYIKYKLQRL